MDKATQLCTFVIGDLLLGIEVLKVQEVIRFQEMTTVPLAPPEVRGLINLRGEIVTALDLRRRLGIADWSEDARPVNVVVHTDGELVSFLVDAVGDVLEVNDADYEAAPETLRPEIRELTRGVYKLEKRLLLYLDWDKAAERRRN